jgi:hypothetical protein
LDFGRKRKKAVWKVDAYLKYGITGTGEGEAVQLMMSPRQWEFRVMRMLGLQTGHCRVVMNWLK